jgi:hypothetical protein
MGLRDDFLRKIAKKQAEIADLERKYASEIQAERRYLQALQDAYKLLPKDGVQAGAETGGRALRKGSGTSRAYEVLKRHGRPMHISAIAEGMGKKAVRTVTQGLASSMRAYVLKGEIFTKPAPNTYGLVEWGDAVNQGDAPPLPEPTIEWPDDDMPPPPAIPPDVPKPAVAAMRGLRFPRKEG